MATAKVEQRRMEKVEVVVRTEDVIVLTLTREEARSLRTVQGRVGGLPSGRRRHFDSIGAALNALGIEPDTKAFNDAYNAYNGVTFV